MSRGLRERSYGRALVLALIAAFCATFAVAVGYGAVSLALRDQPPGEATGRVLEAEGTWSDGGYAVIEFTTEDGQVVRFRGSRDEWRVADGEEIDIRYDPRNPAFSAEKATGWWAVVYTSLFSLLSAYAAVMTARTVPRQLSDRVPGW